MYIVKKKNTYIHWWGKIIVLISNDEYYKLNDLETYLVQKIMRNNNSINVINSISNELEVDTCEAEEFVSIFLNNYDSIFEYKKQNKAMNISGEKGKYFPFELHISLTNMCNQKCIHCYKKAGEANEKIDYNELLNFLKYMEGKVPFLTLSGGDALMYPYIENILNIFGNTYQICVMTSGFDIKDSQVDALKKARRSVYMSVYSSKPEIHDKFVGVKNSYKKIIDNIEKLCSKKIHVGVSTLLTETNSDDIIELVSILDKMGINRISLGLISNIGRAKEKGLSAKDKDKVIDNMKKIKEQFDDIVVLQEVEENKRKRIFSPFKCMAGSLLWCLYENGEIYPCGVCKEKNLLMGSVNNYEECIDNITSYYERISKLLIIKKLESLEDVCPFMEET